MFITTETGMSALRLWAMTPRMSKPPLDPSPRRMRPEPRPSRAPASTAPRKGSPCRGARRSIPWKNSSMRGKRRVLIRVLRTNSRETKTHPSTKRQMLRMKTIAERGSGTHWCRMTPRPVTPPATKPSRSTIRPNAMAVRADPTTISTNPKTFLPMRRTPSLRRLREACAPRGWLRKHSRYCSGWIPRYPASGLRRVYHGTGRSI